MVHTAATQMESVSFISILWGPSFRRQPGKESLDPQFTSLSRDRWTSNKVHIGSLIPPSPHYSIVGHLKNLGCVGTQFHGWLKILALTILYFFQSLIKRDMSKFGSILQLFLKVNKIQRQVPLQG